MRYSEPAASLVTTTAQMLEILFTSINSAAWDSIFAELVRHPTLRHSDRTHGIATDIQRRLWCGGKKRGAGPIDVLIAAVALQHGVTVVHYDADYEHIAHVVPEFRQEWIAHRGSL